MVSSFIEYLDELRVYGVETAFAAVAFELVSLEPLAGANFFLPFLGFTFLGLGLGFGFGYFIHHLTRNPPSAENCPRVLMSPVAKRET